MGARSKPHGALAACVLVHVGLFVTTAPASPSTPSTPSTMGGPAAVVGSAALGATQSHDAELEELLAEERREADRLRRRGRLRAARARLSELLEDEPEDAATRVLRAACWLEEAKYERGLADARGALADARAALAAAGEDPVRRELVAACARTLAGGLAELGRAREALDVLQEVEDVLDTRRDPRDALALGSVLAAVGEREGAERLFEIGARSTGARSWQALLARAECEHRLGRLEQASVSLVEADRLAGALDGTEPDVLTALADLYFEADREVEETKHRSAAQLYDEALRLAPGHAGALLGMFRLHRYNWMRQRRSAQEFLGELLATRPDSVEGLLAGASADVDDGRLRSARGRLERLETLAPGRREVRVLAATLAWIDNRRDECAAVLEELARTDPGDAVPEREVGKHLCELYRFAEARPFLERAVRRDPEDWAAWTQLGRALANTGDETGGLAALDRAKEAGGLRQDAWRNNTTRVLRKMSLEHTRKETSDLVFSWHPEAAPVLETYLVPFYSAAREELAERYGHTPEPTTIEVFGRHADFSVRSTGFEGFPALGVCFGPVVTAVSPLAELRGGFSWARTSFHEFTHVVHLGLSHNRCPRWITEGLATWEEVRKNPAWTRNMRRDLVDARANGALIPVRELNRAFRGPRILFGYYQGGLLCEMLIERHGFPPMVRLLDAFDRGLDLDAAVTEVFGTTPEAIDVDFAAFVDARIAGLAIEPRWQTGMLTRVKLDLGREAPEEPEARRTWAEGWTTLAWGAWQRGRRVDAEEALRHVLISEVEVARAEFLRGEMALAERDGERASRIWSDALERFPDAKDFRVLVALGSLAYDAGDVEAAERHWLRAETCFPGYPEQALSAERNLAELYFENGRYEDEKRALVRWLAWNAADLEGHRKIAAWHFDNERWDEACASYALANEVDPFLRRLHRDWGEALFEAGRYEEAAREFDVALLVPVELDADQPGELEPDERAELLGWEARSLAALGRGDEAIDHARRGLELDEDCEPCAEALETLE